MRGALYLKHRCSESASMEVVDEAWSAEVMRDKGKKKADNTMIIESADSDRDVAMDNEAILPAMSAPATRELEKFMIEELSIAANKERRLHAFRMYSAVLGEMHLQIIRCCILTVEIAEFGIAGSNSTRQLWRRLAAKLGEQACQLLNWPTSIPFPVEAESKKGIGILTVAQAEDLMKAITHTEYEKRFRVVCVGKGTRAHNGMLSKLCIEMHLNIPTQIWPIIKYRSSSRMRRSGASAGSLVNGSF